MIRVLIFCHFNSARSPMAEAALRHAAQQAALPLEVWSAGTDIESVQPQAVQVMAEVGIDMSSARSKTLWEVPDPQEFDYVITVCASAEEACPSYIYPRATCRHYPFANPVGGSLERWRAVRDQITAQFSAFIQALAGGRLPPPGYDFTPAVPD